MFSRAGDLAISINDKLDSSYSKFPTDFPNNQSLPYIVKFNRNNKWFFSYNVMYNINGASLNIGTDDGNGKSANLSIFRMASFDEIVLNYSNTSGYQKTTNVSTKDFYSNIDQYIDMFFASMMDIHPLPSTTQH